VCGATNQFIIHMVVVSGQGCLEVRGEVTEVMMCGESGRGVLEVSSVLGGGDPHFAMSVRRPIYISYITWGSLTRPVNARAGITSSLITTLVNSSTVYVLGPTLPWI
jgi:hypothetical protein